MESTYFTQLLLYGGLLCLLMSIMIFGSLYYNPRLWLQDYPQAIKDRVAPNTPAEKRLQMVLMVPFLLSFIGIPFLAMQQLEAAGYTVDFLTAFIGVALILNLFNLFDAVVIDLLILTLMEPKFIVIPGAEGMEYTYRDWPFQIRNFLKGIVISTVFSLPIALAAVLL